MILALLVVASCGPKAKPSGDTALANRVAAPPPEPKGTNCTTAPKFPTAVTSPGTGAIVGAVFEAKLCEAAIGATVVATSPVLTGEQVMITDENGFYVMRDLPPGVYTLTYYYDNNVDAQPKIEVRIGHTAHAVHTMSAPAESSLIH